MARKLRFEALYPYPPEQVWTALTDPAAIGEWLMPNDFLPEVGHFFTFTTKPAPGFDGIVRCEVLIVEAPVHLAYSWKGGGIDTVVSYRLAPEGSATRLIMEQSGFTGLKGYMVSKILGGGWKRMIAERLPAAAARVRDGLYHSDPGAAESRCHAD
jgi:uncharacterized protein YndB with AHSA1/START domain